MRAGTAPGDDAGPSLRSSRRVRACAFALLALLCGFVVFVFAAQPRAVAAAAAPAAAQDELLVTFLHTSDEHSTLLPAPFVEYRPGEPGPTLGGFARLASVVQRVRADKAVAGETVVLTSAGDNFGGAPFAWLILDGRAPELSLMVELGYDVIGFGNHEFDYGSERLAGYLAAAGYPAAAEHTAVVATNTQPPAGHPLGERGLQRTHMKTLPNGVRIGYLALIGEGAARFTPLAPPVTFVDAHEAAAAAVEELQAAGAHIVVAITHSGVNEDRALAQAVPGIDVILGGHDHTLLDEPLLEDRTLIMHPGSHLRQIAMLELAVDTAARTARLRNAASGAPFVIPLDNAVPESPTMAARVAEYRALLDARIAELSGGRVGVLDETIATSAFPLPIQPALAESPLGNFVTDAMRSAAQAATGARVDFAFQANGVIRDQLTPGASEWNRGVITFYDLASAVGMGSGPDSLPGYPLIALHLTGDEIIRVIELSVLLSSLLGNSYYLQAAGLRAHYDPRRAVIARIPIRGTPIPSGRAVLSAERQAGDGFVTLARGDTTLYHVVTDRYVASFLPMVGRVVPRLNVVPKDHAGRPIADIDDAIVRRDGQELKVWQAVLEFAALQPAGTNGAPRIDERYAATEGRLVASRGTPLWLWPVALLMLAGAAIVLLLQARRRRRRQQPASPGLTGSRRSPSMQS
jgi:5'-nucleotidase / UDP-sugar diphosphatase